MKQRRVRTVAASTIAALLVSLSFQTSWSSPTAAPVVSIDGTEISTDEVELFDISVSDLQEASVTPADGGRSLADDGFLYGTREFPVPADVIARSALGEHPGQDGTDIILSAPIPVLDSNDETAFEAFNYSSVSIGSGFVVVAAHSRAKLVDVVEGASLDPKLETRHLTSRGIVQVTPDASATGTRLVTAASLAALIEADKATLLRQSATELNVLELENMAALNNIAGLAHVDPATDLLAKTYAGQDSEGGYGGIITPTKYLNARYGGTWTLTTSKLLTMPSFTMTQIKTQAGKTSDSNHCVPTAVARAFVHARYKGYSKISSNNASVYLTARSSAAKHGWTTSGGTNPVNIDNIIEYMGDAYGYPNTDSKGVYLFSYDTVTDQVDANRPLLWNIASGYYGKHTVTVRGYAKFKSSTGKVSRMVAVYDGWKDATRYVDYDAFATSSLASFNTVHVK